jgi:hypothetical protein
MDTRSFEILTRQLKTANTKHGRGKKKRQKQNGRACPPAVDRCMHQGTDCVTSFTGICGGNPACLSRASCCSFFSRCDAAGFLACIGL